jgi:hypothetical protein
MDMVDDATSEEQARLGKKRRSGRQPGCCGPGLRNMARRARSTPIGRLHPDSRAGIEHAPVGVYFCSRLRRPTGNLGLA